MVLVDSVPYKWPFDGDLRPGNTALVIIDMQVDFCAPGGYVDQMGYDISATRAPIIHIKKVLEAFRAGGFKVIHTREGHRPDLSDLPQNKLYRSKTIGATIGEAGPTGRILTRGEPGWEIVPELEPLPGEPIIDKPGKGSFYATDLDMILQLAGIRNIVLTGVTTDVCVHTTMRDANDRGYECLILSDCTGATDPGNHAAALKMVTMQGGVFGAVASSADLLSALSAGGLVPAVPNGISTESPTSVAIPKSVVVKATPSDYILPLGKTAVIMIDFQKDFMLEGGFGEALGNNVSLLKACIPGAQLLLKAARAAGLPIVHTLEAHKPDLSDLPPSKLKRGDPPPGQRIGDAGPMGRILISGEDGNGIIDNVAPLPGEKLVHKPGKGAFYATDLQDYLQARGITHLLFGGVTTEVCVQTTMREANDRGYENLLVTDATESYFPHFKLATIEMVTSQGPIVAWAATAADVAEALTGA
eukprot:jgi/Botrbrau1/17556/Bobra.0166s0004.1